MDKYGLLTIVASRPVLLMSKTVSIITGVLSFNTWKMMIASILDLLPATFIYALIGALFISSDYSILGLIVVLQVLGGLWFLDWY